MAPKGALGHRVQGAPELLIRGTRPLACPGNQFLSRPNGNVLLTFHLNGDDQVAPSEEQVAQLFVDSAILEFRTKKDFLGKQRLRCNVSCYQLGVICSRHFSLPRNRHRPGSILLALAGLPRTPLPNQRSVTYRFGWSQNLHSASPFIACMCPRAGPQKRYRILYDTH
jgi:hypothetical protein